MAKHFLLGIEEQVRKRPDAIALKWEEDNDAYFLSYSQVWDITAKGASHLLDVYGPDQIYWVCVANEHQFALAELAALRAGTLIPIEPNTPRFRLESIYQDCPPVCCITDQTTSKFPCHTCNIQKLWQWHAHPGMTFSYRASSSRAPIPHSGAYGKMAEQKLHKGELSAFSVISHIFFTSGTTGKPKGVRGTAQGLTNYAYAKNMAHRIGETSIVLGASAATFDPSLGDLISALVGGAAYACGGPIAQLKRRISLFKATHVQMSPSAYAAIGLRLDECTTLECIALGGEPFPYKLARKIETLIESGQAGIPRVLNTYGVTESCVYQMYHEVRSEHACRFLGHPLPGNTWRVENGELVLGGIQVCDGYVKRPALTQDKFRNGEYFTGDMVARKSAHPDDDDETGTEHNCSPSSCHSSSCFWEVTGRKDFQVKIRGVRIELEEIEAVLQTTVPWIRHVFCFVDDGRLHVHVEPVEGHRDALHHLLRRVMSECLPPTHQPGEVHFGPIELNASGKIDRAQRLRKDGCDGCDDDNERQPSGEHEQKVAFVWSQELGRPVRSFDRLWTYADAGGDSLSALRAGWRLYLLQGHEVQDEKMTGLLKEPFDAPTVLSTSLKQYALMLKHMDEKRKNVDPTITHEPAYAIADESTSLIKAVEGHMEDKNDTSDENMLNNTSVKSDKDKEELYANFLLRAAESDHRMIVSHLLSFYTPPVAKCKERTRAQRRRTDEVKRPTSALHGAAREGHLECCKLLIDAAPKLVTAADGMGELPIHHARSVKTVELLLHWCPITVRGNNLQTLLHCSARRGDAQVLAFLLPRWIAMVENDEKSLKVFGSHVDWRDRWHRTALSWACLNHRVECAKLLLDARANPDAKIRDHQHKKDTRADNESPREIAARVGFTLPGLT